MSLEWPASQYTELKELQKSFGIRILKSIRINREFKQIDGHLKSMWPAYREQIKRQASVGQIQNYKNRSFDRLKVFVRMKIELAARSRLIYLYSMCFFQMTCHCLSNV